MTGFEKEQRISELYFEKAKYENKLAKYQDALKMCNSLQSELESCTNSITETKANLKKAMVLGKKEPDDNKLEEATDTAANIKNTICEIEGILNEECVKFNRIISDCDAQIEIQKSRTDGEE